MTQHENKVASYFAEISHSSRKGMNSRLYVM